MISRTKAVLIFLFFSISTISLSWQKQKAKWQGTIEEVDGITVVKNPKEPMYGEDVFNLEEEVSIGEAEGREEYMFSQVGSIAVDNEGRIYVSDIKEFHIKIFDRDGNYLKSIGRKGYYYDVLDSEGKYIAKVPLGARPQSWKKRKLYTIEEDEDGYQYIKRYKVTWKY